ncbi:hypothetical protein P3T40_006515 [Paraburkholderia sp. EB58]|jgi:hypothetical protein
MECIRYRAVATHRTSMDLFFWLLLNLCVPLAGPVSLLALFSLTHGYGVARELIVESVRGGRLVAMVSNFALRRSDLRGYHPVGGEGRDALARTEHRGALFHWLCMCDSHHDNDDRGSRGETFRTVASEPRSSPEHVAALSTRVGFYRSRLRCSGCFRVLAHLFQLTIFILNELKC